MDYVLEIARILLTMAMILSGYQGSSKKYTSQDTGIEQLSASNHGKAIQSFDGALGKSGGLMGIFGMDALEYRTETKYKTENYTATAHTCRVLNQVDKARPGYVDRQNVLYIKARELDRVMEAYQAAYGLDTEKNETDGKDGGDSADNKDGKNGKKDANRENGTDGGDANNGTGSTGGEGTATVFSQVTVLLSLGQALTEAEWLDDARTLYQQAIDDDIRGDELYSCMGLCEMKAGDLNIALPYPDTDTRLPGEGARQKALYSRVVVYEQGQDFTTALELLETYAIVYGNMPEVDREIIFLKSRQQ